MVWLVVAGVVASAAALVRLAVDGLRTRAWIGRDHRYADLPPATLPPRGTKGRREVGRFAPRDVGPGVPHPLAEPEELARDLVPAGVAAYFAGAVQGRWRLAPGPSGVTTIHPDGRQVPLADDPGLVDELRRAREDQPAPRRPMPDGLGLGSVLVINAGVAVFVVGLLVLLLGGLAPGVIALAAGIVAAVASGLAVYADRRRPGWTARGLAVCEQVTALQGAVASGAVPGPDEFAALFAHVVALGSGAEWARRYAATGAPAPAWWLGDPAGLAEAVDEAWRTIGGTL